MKKRVIIVGSGLGGLSCGAILAKNGFEVVVLEQNSQIGGCLQCFRRRDAKFETGMHFIGSVAAGEKLSGLWNYLELADSVQLSQLDRKAYNVYSFAGNRYSVPAGENAFFEKLKADFPDSADEIANFEKEIDAVVENSSLDTFTGEKSFNIESLMSGERSLSAVLDESIHDKKIQNILLGNLPLYAAERDKTPFSSFAFIHDFYKRGAYRIVGGSDKIAESLCATIVKYGGKFFVNQKVTRIISESKRVVKVECAGGDQFSGDEFIFAIHPSRLLELTDSKLFHAVFRERVSNMPQSVGCFALYLRFKDEKLPYMNQNFFSFKEESPWNCEVYNAKNWPKGYLYMHFCDEENQKFAKSGVVLSYMNFSDVEKWQNSEIHRRGTDYDLFKRQHAEKIIDALNIDFPNIKDCISEYYTSTPLTYLSYTGTEKGGMYGIAKTVSGGLASRVTHKTKFENLRIAGQNINSHGFQGVLVGTLTVCRDLLPDNNLFKKIICNE